MGSSKKRGIKVLPCEQPQMDCCYKQACSKRQLKGLGKAAPSARVLLEHILNFTQLGTLPFFNKIVPMRKVRNAFVVIRDDYVMVIFDHYVSFLLFLMT